MLTRAALPCGLLSVGCCSVQQRTREVAGRHRVGGCGLSCWAVVRERGCSNQQPGKIGRVQLQKLLSLRNQGLQSGAMACELWAGELCVVFHVCWLLQGMCCRAVLPVGLKCMCRRHPWRIIVSVRQLVAAEVAVLHLASFSEACFCQWSVCVPVDCRRHRLPGVQVVCACDLYVYQDLMWPGLWAC